MKFCYKILQSYYAEELEKLIYNKLQEGFSLHGDLIVLCNRESEQKYIYIQAVKLIRPNAV